MNSKLLSAIRDIAFRCFEIQLTRLANVRSTVTRQSAQDPSICLRNADAKDIPSEWPLYNAVRRNIDFLVQTAAVYDDHSCFLIYLTVITTGPGMKYTLPIDRGPSFSMKWRTKQRKVDETPGPGYVKPIIDAPAFTM